MVRIINRKTNSFTILSAIDQSLIAQLRSGKQTLEKWFAILQAQSYTDAFDPSPLFEELTRVNEVLGHTCGQLAETYSKGCDNLNPTLLLRLKHSFPWAVARQFGREATYALPRLRVGKTVLEAVSIVIMLTQWLLPIPLNIGFQEAS